MAEVTIYENRNRRGYSITLNGDINPENGYYNFASMTVGPRTEVTIYNRNNDLFTVHNGSDGLAHVDDIYADIVIEENVPITLKSTSISHDSSVFMKISHTGEVKALDVASSQRGGSTSLIILLLICVVGYYFISSKMNRRVQDAFYNQSNGSNL